MDPHRNRTTGKTDAPSPTQQAARDAVGAPKKVRMNLDEFRGGFDDALHLLGAFRRHAKAQGWTRAEIEAVTHDAAFRHVVATLKEHIEPTAEPEPLSWRTQFDRNRDYVDGYDAFTGGEVSDLWGWMLRGLKKR